MSRGCAVGSAALLRHRPSDEQYSVCKSGDHHIRSKTGEVYTLRRTAYDGPKRPPDERKIYPGGDFIDRRNERRYPYPYLVRLIPVDRDGTVLHGEAVVAVGKHLSDRGIGFYHPKPLPHRHMVVSLETSDGTGSAFVVDLGWCRFTREGWYESGGKFLDVLSGVPDCYVKQPA
jgi:hypothetical protein